MLFSNDKKVEEKIRLVSFPIMEEQMNKSSRVELLHESFHVLSTHILRKYNSMTDKNRNFAEDNKGKMVI